MHGVDDSDAGFLGTPLYEGGSRDVVALGQPGMDVPAVSVRADGWKYVHTEDSSQLYDLEADPDEQRDVHDENPRVAARLRRTIPDRLFGATPNHRVPLRTKSIRSNSKRWGTWNCVNQTGRDGWLVPFFVLKISIVRFTVLLVAAFALVVAMRQ